MEDSLIGYLSNGLQWCGSLSPAGDGINYTSCPNWQDLPKQASQAYWGGASSTVKINIGRDLFNYQIMCNFQCLILDFRGEFLSVGEQEKYFLVRI